MLARLLLLLATTAFTVNHAHADASVRCMPRQRVAAQLFLGIPCAAHADTTPDVSSACMPEGAPQNEHPRHARGTDLPLTRCARRVAWVLALFGQMMRPHWNTADYTWMPRTFDYSVRRARLNDVPYADLAPELRQAFIDAVHGALGPDDGPVPYVTITSASDPRMRQPISAVAALDLETTAGRYFDHVPAADLPLPYGPTPGVRMDVDSPASIGVYGWDIRARWPTPGAPLRWRVAPEGPRWQTDGVHRFTHDIVDRRATGAEQLDVLEPEAVNPDTIQAGLREIVEVLDGWRLLPFTPYRDGALPGNVRLLAATAKQAITTVREAARAPPVLGSVRHVFVVIRLAGAVQAVLYGSIGRFALGVAEIHAIATPARNMFPHLPLTPVTYRREAVRGAAAHAIHSFVTYAQDRGATMLLYIGQDLPAAPQIQRVPPHDEL